MVGAGWIRTIDLTPTIPGARSELPLSYRPVIEILGLSLRGEKYGYKNDKPRHKRACRTRRDNDFSIVAPTGDVAETGFCVDSWRSL